VLEIYHKQRAPVLAILAGILLALSFPSPGISILAWGALVPLLVAAGGRTPKQTFKLGFLAGFVAYIGIFYWLNIVMTTYGKLPLVVSFSLTLVMSAYLALYIATATVLACLGERRGIPLALGLPVCWVALEFLRSWLLTGFPWATLGYTQYRTLPLIQIADLTGVYGVSFLLVLANVVLFRILGAILGRNGSRYPLALTGLLALLLAACAGYGFVGLNAAESGTRVKVALAQGNIPQDIKWNPAFQEETVSIYERLSRKGAGGNYDLIVWPESSLPFFFEREPAYSARVSNLAKELGTSLIVSSPAMEKGVMKDRYYNSAFLIDRDGTTLGRADKVHLVPFGEYVPLAKLLPFVNKMVEGIGDFSSGETITPLPARFGKLGMLVCFEGIFPEISREYVRKGATVLVNITNDAWFGRSSAPYQHLSMTVFRAVENRVPLVRAANTGITAIIDSRGHIVRMTGLFHEALLTGEIRTGTTTTFYTRYGDVFAWGCVLTALGMGGYLLARRRVGPS
jgi:apolipoprotein N-acyltransferase